MSMVNFILPISQALGENPDFSSVHTVSAIERCLSDFCDRMSKQLLK